jgi:N-acetyl sugar amidotransferase
MDTTANDITFDDQGFCNFCTDFLKKSGHLFKPDPDLQKKHFNDMIARVKASGKGNRYDCIIGVSGGVDSSWVLVQAIRSGLRPLAVHMDNGWNSELAQNNIANLVRTLKVDLYTHVIDWNEYRSLMKAFFDADVVDVELLYDNAMLAVNYQQAAKHGVKYILAGTNQTTEGLRIPQEWNWLKFDKKNIASLGRKFGGVKLRSFPAIGTYEFIWYKLFRGKKWISFLDYLDYNKFVALETLQREFEYKPYPYKHYESIFTRFYQGYILPEKFGIDKRRVHLSTLVISGQITRNEALEGVKGLAYPSEKDLEGDKQYFLKKMGWKSEQLTSYLSRPPKKHSDYPSEKPKWDFCFELYKSYLKQS